MNCPVCSSLEYVNMDGDVVCNGCGCIVQEGPLPEGAEVRVLTFHKDGRVTRNTTGTIVHIVPPNEVLAYPMGTFTAPYAMYRIDVGTDVDMLVPVDTSKHARTTVVIPTNL